MREWIARLIDWLRRDTLDHELADELRHHQAQLTRDARVAGATDADATARRRLGNVTRIRENARDRWSIPYIQELLQDTRYAIRGLRRTPTFTLTVVVTLALGIGANSAMFNVVDRLMVRPQAYLRDPGLVHRVYWQWDNGASPVTSMSTSYARFLDLQRWTTSFALTAAFSERLMSVGEGPTARERRVAAVSATYFDFFDASPVQGRFFGPDEDRTPVGASVAVLSHGFWQAEFGGAEVIGRPIVIGNVRATIIGVAPRNFSGINDADPPIAFIPITTYAGSTGTSDARTYFSRYQWGWVQTMVQRKPDVSLERAGADASQAYRRSWIAGIADDPTMAAIESARPRVAISALRPGAGPNPSLEARTARWVTWVAVIVLLIACANVANLVIARSLRRQRETAVRLALGVSRGRLIRQSLTESFILAIAGGAIALLVSQWSGTAIRAMLIGGTDRENVFTDLRTLGITALLVGLTAIAVGLAPALMLGRGDLAGRLRGGARGGNAEGKQLRAALVVIQAAFCIMLLIGASLFVRSLNAVRTMALGYQPENVMLVNRVIGGAWPGDSAIKAMRVALVTRARSIPGVESVAWISSAPFVSTSNTQLFIPGRDSVNHLGTFTYQATTPEYFRTMGTRIVQGRGLADEDRFGSRDVAVVSESMARTLWPGKTAIGECMRVRVATMPCTTVVGIAEDMVQRDLAGSERYHFYLSIDQFTRTSGNGMLLRLRDDLRLQAEAIRQALQGVMPGTSYVTVQPLADIVGGAQRSWRLGATMFVAFGVLALIVAGVGLYGVIGYDVAQRMHEIGVRVALGAQRADILRLVIGQSVWLAGLGTALGITGAFVAARWIQPLLFRQSATDAGVFAGVGFAMIAVAVVASLTPALRASRADPNGPLRSE